MDPLREKFIEIETNKNRVGQKPCMFEISKEKAIDMDGKFDFELVEWMIGARKSRRGASP